MRRAIKLQVLALIALLVLLTVSSGVLGAFGDDTGAPQSDTQVTEPAAPEVEPPAPEQEPELVEEPEPAETTGALDDAEVPAEEVAEEDAPAGEEPPEAAFMPLSDAPAEQAADALAAPAPADEPQADWSSNAVVEALVSEDTNCNGVGDESPDALLDGVTVNLYRLETDSSWTFIGSTVSGPGAYGPFGIYQPPPFGYSHGWVGWNNLPAGNGELDYVDYVLEMVPPPGYFATGHGAVRIGRVWAQTIGHPFCWWRFFYGEDGFLLGRKAKIQGYKFADLNENGVMDPGEAGMQGVLIVLDHGADSVNTNADGFFSFEVMPGTHTVAVDESTAPGYYPTTPTSLDVEVTCGEEKTVYFGNAPYGSISGHKWEDLNRDGNLDDGEPPLAGVTIKLTGTTTKGDPVSLETVTGADGSYSFTNLKAGTYQVTEVVPADWEATSDITIDVTLEPGENVTDVDFFNARTKGRLQGYKFIDLNENGEMDPGELGLEGVSIILDGGEDMAVTDADGYFSFEVLPGEHVVAVDESTAPGYYPTTPIILTVEVAAGGETTVYFGNAPFGSIAGTKWEDTNQNSIADGDEVPVAGVTIQLTGVTSLDGETVTMETLTASDGTYKFEGLKAGEYTVSEIVPINMSAVSPESVDVTLVPGEALADVDFFNVPTGNPEPPNPPNPPTPPDPGTPQPTSAAPSGTLPVTGMNQVPYRVAAGLAVLAGLGLLGAGVLLRRRRPVPDGAPGPVSGRTWK